MFEPPGYFFKLLIASRTEIWWQECDLIRSISRAMSVPNALQLLRSMGAERGAQRILDGEDPRPVLQSYADLAEKMVSEAEENPEARKNAYQMIEIRQVIERILAQKELKP